MYADKAYDSSEVRELHQDLGYTVHISHRREGIKAWRKTPKYRARRWVVENPQLAEQVQATFHPWEKKHENYLAMLHFVRMDHLPRHETFRIGL